MPAPLVAIAALFYALRPRRDPRIVIPRKTAIPRTDHRDPDYGKRFELTRQTTVFANAGFQVVHQGVERQIVTASISSASLFCSAVLVCRVVRARLWRERL